MYMLQHEQQLGSCNDLHIPLSRLVLYARSIHKSMLGCKTSHSPQLFSVIMTAMPLVLNAMELDMYTLRTCSMVCQILTECLRQTWIAIWSISHVNSGAQKMSATVVIVWVNPLENKHVLQTMVCCSLLT